MKSTRYKGPFDNRASEWIGDLTVWTRENAGDNSERLERLRRNLRQAREREILAMDTVMKLTIYGENAPQAGEAAVDRIQELEGLLSVTGEDSEIYAANHTGSAQLSPDAAALLEEMERLEQTGTTFQDKQKQDAKPVRYAGAVVMALLTTALMAALIVLMVWGFTVDPADAPPLALLLVLVAIPGVIILGVLLALFQRIKEIQKGEEDDAKNY